MSTRFTFTVTDAARFIGKSPVTLRGWERQKMVKLPRDPGGDRKFYIEDIWNLALVAEKRGRISRDRLRMAQATLTMLRMLEKENRK